MRPVILTLEAIDQAYDTVRASGLEPTGVRVIQCLRQTLGRVGGTARVYRRIEERREGKELSQARHDIAELRRQNDTLREALQRMEQQRAEAIQRAELAEDRERAHTNRQADEIYDLRQALRAANAERASRGQEADRYLDLYRRWHAAQARIAELEAEKELREKAATAH